MKHRLSSAQTLLMKVAFPVVWIGGFGAGTLALAIVGPRIHGTAGPTPPALRALFPVVWAVGSSLIYWSCVRLKRVCMDADSLYVSNYLREIRVPIENVVEVTENRWIRSHLITVRVSPPIQFGERIVFMPKTRIFAFGPHPAVHEIRAAVRAKRGDPVIV